jgi:superfamily II DNA or RNA helicase
LSSRNIDFTYSSDINDNVNVHVILPQNHNKITVEYDLIIVDEAHENYFAKTVQNIINKTKVKKEILLTGTPHQFIDKKEFKMYFVSLSDLDSSIIPKLRVDIIESDYDWNDSYNESREVKTDFKFKDSSTQKSLKKTFDLILDRNKNNKIEKTIIVCRNISQSNSVKSYLNKIGLSCEISNSENDKSSDKISDFKNNLFNILIVVNRARLGYDDVDLINLIDISGTLNPNIIYQMFARLLRGSNDTQKYYIRLTSKDDSILNSEIATSVALMLTHKNYIQASSVCRHHPCQIK